MNERARDTLVYRLAQMLVKLNQSEKLEAEMLRYVESSRGKTASREREGSR